MFEYRASLIRIVDGDTIDLDVDLGFNVHVHERFRLAGINAPEMRTPEGIKAKEWLEAAIGKIFVLTVRTEKIPKQEKYGRWLARISIPGMDDVGAAMVAAGMAKIYMEK